MTRRQRMVAAVLWLRSLWQPVRPLPVVLPPPEPATDPLLALWERSAVEPDRSLHVYPPMTTTTIEAGAEWLRLAYPHPWSHADIKLRELTAGVWLQLRVAAREGVPTP